MKIKRRTVKVLDNPGQRKDQKPRTKEQREARKRFDSLSDEYQPMCGGERVLVREYVGYNGKAVKDYLDFSIKRFDDDEARVMCFVSTYRESEKYTGFLKGKTVCFPIASFADVLEAMSTMDDRAEGIREDETRKWGMV